jgi:hypothetical protein
MILSGTSDQYGRSPTQTVAMTLRRIALPLVFSAAMLGACGAKTTTTTAGKTNSATTAPAAAAAGGATTVAGAAADPAQNGSRPTIDPVAMKAYTDCMTTNGVDIAAGGFGGRNGGGGGRNGGQQDPNAAPPSSTSVDPNAAPTTTIDQAKLDAARTACADKRPAGMGRGGQGGQGGPNNQAFTAYRSCLTDHGLTLPTRNPGGQQGGQGGQPADAQTPATGSTPPTFPKNNGSITDGQPPADGQGGPGGGRGNPTFGLDQNDPAVKAAMEACAPLLPTPQTGSSTTAVAG